MMNCIRLHSWKRLAELLSSEHIPVCWLRCGLGCSKALKTQWGWRNHLLSKSQKPKEISQASHGRWNWCLKRLFPDCAEKFSLDPIWAAWRWRRTMVYIWDGTSRGQVLPFNVRKIQENYSYAFPKLLSKEKGQYRSKKFFMMLVIQMT